MIVQKKIQLKKNAIRFAMITGAEVNAHALVVLKMTEKIIGQNPQSNKDFLEKMNERKNPLLILAYLDQKIVGFKFGFEKSRHKFSSSLGGVLPTYRGHGIASHMMLLQHEHCFKKMKYRQIETHSANKYKNMMMLNLKFGFDITGSYVDEDDCMLKIIFIKTEGLRRPPTLLA